MSRKDPMQDPPFDREAAHRFFAADCFNSAWKLLELEERSVEQDEELVALGHASLWHWLHRPDRSDQTTAVAYWMLGRIYATISQAERALHYARLCAAVAERARLEPFYQGCAHEVLARAHSLSGNRAAREEHLAKGRQIAQRLSGNEERILTADLDDVAGRTLS